jgi:hypothetical protein
LGHGDHVFADQLFVGGAGQRGAQHGAQVADRAQGGHTTAAFADCAAATGFCWSAGVFALGAALAGGADLVEPGLYVADGELVQAFRAQAGHDV